MHRFEFSVHNTPEETAIMLANKMASLIQVAVAKRGECHMVIPGGRSPVGVFEILRNQCLPWSVLHLYPSDERCVPVGSLERNDHLIDELLLAHAPIPKDNLHRIPAELGSDEGARLYNELLEHVPRFDIVFLGAGEDGHTASLFPGAITLDDKRAAVSVRGAPKPPADRITIGLSRLRDAYERCVLITGAEKQKVVHQIRQGLDLPVTRVQPTAFFIDKAANNE